MIFLSKLSPKHSTVLGTTSLTPAVQFPWDSLLHNAYSCVSLEVLFGGLFFFLVDNCFEAIIKVCAVLVELLSGGQLFHQNIYTSFLFL